MHRNLSLCSSIDSKRARGEENAKQTLDARARKHAKNTRREEEEEEEEEKKQQQQNDEKKWILYYIVLIYCNYVL